MGTALLWSSKEALAMQDSTSDNEEPFLYTNKDGRGSSTSDDQEAMLPPNHEPSTARQIQHTRHSIIIVALVSALVSALGTILMHNLLPLPPISSSSLASITRGASAPTTELLPLLDLPPLGNLLRTYVGGGANFQSHNVNKSREAWMSLFPPGMGYISMNKVKENGEIPQVIQNMSTDGSGRFCVAAFHQLHCLYLIWEDYRRAMSGETTKSTSTEGEHSIHCFDYLRESIICAADSSLEPFRSPFDGGGTKGNGVDGFGTVHQCRNFGLLYDWSEKFRYGEGHDAHNFEG